MTSDEFKTAWEVLASPSLKQLVVKLRYMGNQYAAGQASRGGGQKKHYLQEAADELERLFAQSVNQGQQAADLRNVVQAACIGGIPAMAAAWEKYFPDQPISIAAVEGPWKTVAQDGLPPCDGHTTYIGINSAGYACCFTAMRGSLCVMETAEGTYCQMSDLRNWRLLDRPARTAGVTTPQPPKEN